MRKCIALLGGSFDPVHLGHLALADTFVQLLQADELRVIPARPWQKSTLQASDAQRIDMLQLAFAASRVPVVIDTQELERDGPTYTVDTLRALRAELGDDVSLVFLIGADQLQRLDTWRDWHALFELANLGVAARPGFSLADAALPPAVVQELALRRASPEQLRATPCGLVSVAPSLAVDVSATEIRSALCQEDKTNALLPSVVLDYIQQHHLYKN
ncbi:nicotinate-nucleotide adenylyltransferase [Massilia sp. S19_KUP03_FR1]|uniref:nicotinate-nucleotide adenylyltransferase n=1 Tax=Massilia sp. S19_KUP03_FR1 TaxID=3025503 RepID=UPI002FCD9695